MKLLKILAASTLALAIASTSSFADVQKGQKAFIKFLKEPWGWMEQNFALKHTQEEEWRK